MAAKCPKCGATLRWYDFRAECKKCGVNIPNYRWESRLEEDADTAERAFAVFHYKLNNFKSGTAGNAFRIVRLVFTLLPLVALVVPLIKLNFSMPYYEDSQSVSFLTFILDYLTKFDIMGGFKLMSATVIGPTVKMLMFSIISAFVAVVVAVINFFVVLIAAISLKAGWNIALNLISTLCWAASAVFLIMFTNNAAELSINMLSGTVQWGYIVGVVLFLAGVIINIITGKSFKKQLSEQLSLEESVEKELRELPELQRKEALENK